MRGVEASWATAFEPRQLETWGLLSPGKIWPWSEPTMLVLRADSSLHDLPR